MSPYVMLCDIHVVGLILGYFRPFARVGGCFP